MTRTYLIHRLPTAGHELRLTREDRGDPWKLTFRTPDSEAFPLVILISNSQMGHALEDLFAQKGNFATTYAPDERQPPRTPADWQGLNAHSYAFVVNSEKQTVYGTEEAIEHLGEIIGAKAQVRPVDCLTLDPILPSLEGADFSAIGTWLLSNLPECQLRRFVDHAMAALVRNPQLEAALSRQEATLRTQIETGSTLYRTIAHFRGRLRTAMAALTRVAAAERSPKVGDDSTSWNDHVAWMAAIAQSELDFQAAETERVTREAIAQRKAAIDALMAQNGGNESVHASDVALEQMSRTEQALALGERANTRAAPFFRHPTPQPKDPNP